MTGRTLAVGIAAVVFTITVMLLSYASAPSGMLVLPDATPMPVPTISPTSVTLVESSFSPVSLPTRPPVNPTATPVPPLVDLNFASTGVLTGLGLSPDQARAVYVFRCTPAQPLYVPYPLELEGCGPDAAGIVTLRQLVEAGVLTVDEVIEHLSGKVTQTWD